MLRVAAAEIIVDRLYEVAEDSSQVPPQAFEQLVQAILPWRAGS
jgi:hypothetical protein